MKIPHRFSTGILSAIILAAGCAAVCAQTSYKFNFGGKAEAGWTQVSPTTAYSDQAGYGFEPGATPAAVGNDALGANQPFYFSVKEPEGNYQVTVTFGSASATSDNTVKAELRRLMLEKIHTDAGQSVTRSFVVNVRVPQYPGGQVRLKAPRETTQEARAWDDKLTIEFNHDDANSAVSKIEIQRWTRPRFTSSATRPCATSPVSLSTVGDRCCRAGLAPASPLPTMPNPAKRLPAPSARKRFAKVYSLLKPGDYVFMQFAHNDMKNNAPARSTNINPTM